MRGKEAGGAFNLFDSIDREAVQRRMLTGLAQRIWVLLRPALLLVVLESTQLLHDEVSSYFHVYWRGGGMGWGWGNQERV